MKLKHKHTTQIMNKVSELKTFRSLRKGGVQVPGERKDHSIFPHKII